MSRRSRLRLVCNGDPPETYFVEEAPRFAHTVLALLVLAYGAGVFLVGIGLAYLIEAVRLWLLG